MQLLASVCLILYACIMMISLLPQIRIHFKEKSTRGINPWMVLCLTNGYILGLWYIFAAQLPFIYKITGPISCCFSFLLLGQQLYYHSSLYANKIFIVALLTNFLTYGFLGAAVLGGFIIDSWFIGIGSIFFTANSQIPQLLTIYHKKSIEGCSPLFMSLTAVAFGFELIAAIILPLPSIVIMNDIRALFFYGIFCSFWYTYYQAAHHELL